MLPVLDCLGIVTVEQPEVRLLPLTSLAWTVSTWVAMPFAVIVELIGVSVDWVASASPSTYATLAWIWLPSLLYALPISRVATNTPDPVAVGAVTVAV